MKTEKTRTELLEEFYSAPLDALFDETVVAAIRGCDKTTLQRDRWAGGGIPFLKLKRAVRYRKRDVLRWLDQYSPQASTSDPTPSRRQQHERIAAEVASHAGRHSAPGAPFDESICRDAAVDDSHDDSRGDYTS